MVTQHQGGGTEGLFERLEPRMDHLKRRYNALFRPSAERNRQRLRERGESVDSITVRDADGADIGSLADLHLTTSNATWRPRRGPTYAARKRQWNDVFRAEARRDFVIVLEDRARRLIGFAWGHPYAGEFAGELSRIYLLWEYHGLGLGRRMLVESAKRFLARGMSSFVLYTRTTNPSIGFFDRMGGERLVDERGRFSGGFAWRDARALLE